LLTELSYHYFNLTQVTTGFQLFHVGFSALAWSDWAMGLALLSAGCVVWWSSGAAERPHT
jgi:hypothetical protein